VAPGPKDPRNTIKNVGVPVIEVLEQGDYALTAFFDAFAMRRPDSDAPGDRFRLYDIAGTSHFDLAPYRAGFPRLKDMMAAGAKVPSRVLPPGLEAYTGFPKPPYPDSPCDPDLVTEQPIAGYMFHSAFMNLDTWVRKGIPAPKAARLEEKDAGTPQASVALDKYGNALGGVRTPLVDVPIATYHVTHKGSIFCLVMGWAEPFDWARLEALYGNQKNYAAKFSQAVDRAVKERWLTESDAKKMKAELTTPRTY
jgi:hypothetical protein